MHQGCFYVSLKNKYLSSWYITMSLPAGKTPVVHFDASDSASITRSGTTLTAWTNKGSAGGSTTTTEGTISTNTITQNSKNMIVFNSSSKATIGNITMPSQAQYAFIVTKITALNPYVGFFANQQSGGSQFTASSSGGFFSGNFISVGPNSVRDNLVAQNLPSFTAPTSPLMLSIIIHSSVPASNAFKLNGTSQALFASTVGGYTSDSRTYTINIQNNASQRMGEMIIFGTDLTTTEITNTEGYLAWKWGIQANLDASHPYYPVKVAVNALSFAGGGVSISWTAGIYSSFNVYRDTQISGATKSLITTTSSSSYSDSSATSGTYYYFVEGAVQGTFSGLMSDVQSFTPPTDDKAPNIAVDSSGKVYVVYQTTGTASGGTLTTASDTVIFKMDTSGNMIWIKQQPRMNTSGNDQSPTIAVDAAGSVYIAYYTNGTVSGGAFRGGAGDIVVYKMDTNGNMVWIKESTVYNTIGAESYPSISVDAAGNVYVSYQTNGTVSGGSNRGAYDYAVFKMDANGNVVWVKQQAVMNTASDELSSKVKVDAAGNVYITYYTSGTVSGGTFLGSVYDIVIIKLDTNGNIAWVKQQAVMNTTSDDINPAIAVDVSGNVYVSYQTAGVISGGTSSGGTDIVFLKLDTNGNILWTNQEPIMNTSGADTIPSIAVDASGNIYLSYQTTGTVSGGTFRGVSDVVMVKYAATPEVYVPDVPTNLTAVPLEAGNGALVSWKAPLYNGNADITSYTVTSTPGNIQVTSATTSANVTGLTNGVPYTFTVFATNYVGDSIQTAPSSAITIAAIPSAPNNLVITKGNNQVSLSWDAPSSTGGVALSGYRITFSPGNIVVNVSSVTTSTTVTGLYDNIDYTVNIQAVNTTGAGTVVSGAFRITNTAAVDAVQAAKTNFASFQTYADANNTKSVLQTYLELRNTIKQQNLSNEDEQVVRKSFIDAIRTLNNGNTVLTVPRADASIVTNSMKTLSSSIPDKDTQAVFPEYTNGVGTIDVNTLVTDGSILTNFEIPPNSSLTLTDGVHSITLAYNGTTLSDGTRTYVTGDVLRLGTTYYKLVGIGSILFDLFPEKYQLVMAQGLIQIQTQGANKILFILGQRGL
jgi:hypothetical protein